MPQRISWKKPVALLVVVVLAALVAHAWSDRGKAAPGKPATAQAVPVKVARAERGDLDLSLKVNGYAEAYSTVTVQSRVNGQLQAVAFTPGGRVHQGEVIARIDPSLLQAQLDQSRGILAKGYVSKTDYDGYRANVGIYAASVKADQAAVEMAQTQLGYAQIKAPVD